jgi:RNA polymerase sigma-70 factor (TIGR02960 family)
MSAVTTPEPGTDEARFVRAAQTDDAAAFAVLTERFRRELHVHCYRMLASFDDAEDQTQETFLRAWRSRHTFAGRSSLRTWLYRIATNTCLDLLQQRGNRIPLRSSDPSAPPEVAHLQPYPDELLDQVAGDDTGPDEQVVSRETIELAFLVAVQHLPPRQRAALILSDVLGWPARRTAETLDTTVAATNSALQRARATLRERLPDRRTDWSAAAVGHLSADDRRLLHDYVAAHERDDLDGLVALLHEELRFAMPPEPGTWVGRDAIVASWQESGFGSPTFGSLRCTVTRLNRQPAMVAYQRRPDDEVYRALAVDVLTVHDGLVTDIVTFPFEACRGLDLPATSPRSTLEGSPPTAGS